MQESTNLTTNNMYCKPMWKPHAMNLKTTHTALMNNGRGLGNKEILVSEFVTRPK
jgi:hypothetical protein